MRDSTTPKGSSAAGAVSTPWLTGRKIRDSAEAFTVADGKTTAVTVIASGMIPSTSIVPAQRFSSAACQTTVTRHGAFSQTRVRQSPSPEICGGGHPCGVRLVRSEKRSSQPQTEPAKQSSPAGVKWNSGLI